MNKICKKIRLPATIDHIIRQAYYKYCFTNEAFLKKYFKIHTGRELNLKEPIEFNDKLQWLKLYWYDSFATKCADKFEVRNIVKQKVGHEVLNELYGVYESVDDINISKLPDSFVMKATHSSGYNFVCKDKNKVNWDSKLKELNKWLKLNYYWHTRELVYKDIKPRIICERYLSEVEGLTSLTDYKIYCFNGKPTYCQVIKDRNSGGTIDFFDTEWNHMEFTGLQKMPNAVEKIEKPVNYDEMLGVAKELSKDFPFVRVDFYNVDSKIYFGELTFFPRSGFGEFFPHEWNKRIGNLLELPNRGNVYKNNE